MNKEELMTLPMLQRTLHCSCLEHCFLRICRHRRSSRYLHVNCRQHQLVRVGERYHSRWRDETRTRNETPALNGETLRQKDYVSVPRSTTKKITQSQS